MGKHGLRCGVQVEGVDVSEAAAAKLAMEKAKQEALRRSKTTVPCIKVSGAEGFFANAVNGVYDVIDDKGNVVYKKEGAEVYIYLAEDGRWYVNSREAKDARKNAGWAESEVMTVGSLPVEAKVWKVYDGKVHKEQALRVRFEAFRLVWPRGRMGRPRLGTAKWRTSFF